MNGHAMTQDERNTLWEALAIITREAVAHRGPRRDTQNDWDRAAVALDDALRSEERVIAGRHEG